MLAGTINNEVWTNQKIMEKYFEWMMIYYAVEVIHGKSIC